MNSNSLALADDLYREIPKIDMVAVVDTDTKESKIVKNTGAFDKSLVREMMQQINYDGTMQLQKVNGTGTMSVHKLATGDHLVAVSKYPLSGIIAVHLNQQKVDETTVEEIPDRQNNNEVEEELVMAEEVPKQEPQKIKKERQPKAVKDRDPIRETPTKRESKTDEEDDQEASVFRLQKHILRKNNPRHHFSNVTMVYRPLKKVGGDFFWSADRDGIKHMVLADSQMTGVKGALLSLSLDGIMESYDFMKKSDAKNFTESINKRVQSTNLELVGTEELEEEPMIDLAHISFDPAKSEISWLSSGIGGLLIKKDNVIDVPLDGTFEQTAIKVEKGDRLTFYTDGMSLDNGALLDLMKEKDLDEVLANIIMPVQQDDLTLIVIDF